MTRFFTLLLHGDRHADRVVPPTGHTAWLTSFTAGAMTFLAVFALALLFVPFALQRQSGGLRLPAGLQQGVQHRLARMALSGLLGQPLAQFGRDELVHGVHALANNATVLR